MGSFACWARLTLACVLACMAVVASAAVPRGYTIPTLDLSTQRERQVVVDREPGQYLGHPSTVLLEDGKTIVVVYPKGHGRGPIVLKRSVDGGKTWSERLPTPESWATSKETPTIHRVVDARGVKRLILFSGLYPIRMAVSEDDGLKWTELKPIGDFGGVVAMASVVKLKTAPGHYLALFHDDGRFLASQPAAGPRVFRVYKTLSTDGGLTWSKPAEIATHPQAHLCEPGAIRSPDGNQLAVLLRENSRKLNSFVIFSEDEGKTWSPPRDLPGALTGDRHTGRYAPDGRLFLTFRDTTLDSPTKGDWVGWVGTYQDIVRGREGQYRVRLMKNYKAADCAYPGLELLPDGTLVTTTYGHWMAGEMPYIVSVRLKLAELDALSWERIWKDQQTDASIRSLMGAVNTERMSKQLFYLSKDPLPYRKLNFTLPAHKKNTLEEADDYIADQLKGWGYRVEREGVPVQAFRRDASKPKHAQYSRPKPEDPWYTAYNLYAEKQGRLRPDEIIIVLAHKDSQSWIDSPGANDNAIGTIGVLEMARVLAQTAPRRTIRFLFCNEEHTPWTSVTAAQNAKARGDRIVAVFNLDGIGAKGVEQATAKKKTNVTAFTTPEGERLAQLMGAVNAHYAIGLEQRAAKRPAPGDDDGSFVKAGYPAAVINIGSWPYADPNYHAEGDIPERCDLENAAMTVRATLAAVLTIAQEF